MTIKVYRVQLRRVGAWSWTKREVALHNPRDVGEIRASVEAAFGAAAVAGDQIKVLDGPVQIVAPFTVT